MKISQLKQPYKKMAQFYTEEKNKRKKNLELCDAFTWSTCVSANDTYSHFKFWNDVDDGESPIIPRGILNHFNKHNPKEAFQVMGMPKPVSEKPKSATTKKAQPLTNDNQHLVGRKISAFAFKSGTNGIHYDSEINDYVLGYDGTIIAADPDAIQVSFETKKGTITVYYPFGKDVKSDLSGRSAESFLIPEEEVQKALGNMPKEPFKVGETVYLSGNGGQYKCVIDRIYFCGNYPISLDAGKRTVLQNKTIDGRSQPGGDIVLSRTPWCNEKGFMLDILNAETKDGTDNQPVELLQASSTEKVEYFAEILREIHAQTGEITLEDVNYHAKFIKRSFSK